MGYTSTVLLLFFLLHASLSQKFFRYLNCHEIGGRAFLRVDYSLVCKGEGEEVWNSFVPFVLVMITGFTVALPCVVLGILVYNRKELQTPKIFQRLGFLYVSFVENAWYWGIHEVARKCFLMGVLVFFPTASSRSVAAILICVFSVATLHYSRPHRNRLVFRVSQV